MNSKNLFYFLFLILLGVSSSACSIIMPKSTPEHWTELDGTKIYYEDYGSGDEALVFVHCWCGNHDFWRYQLPAFQEKCRVILLDLPGHGKSDKPHIEYTMEYFARAVNAVCEDAGVDRAVLAGHSMGTPIIREFYRIYPKKTKALVTVDGSLKNLMNDPAQLEKLLAMFDQGEFKTVLAEIMGRMFAPTTSKEIREWIIQAAQQTPKHVAASAMRNMLDPKIWRDDKIEVPVCVILAKAAFWPADYKEYVQTLVDRLDYRVIDGVDHFLQLEKPIEFNQILNEFLINQGLVKAQH